MEVMEKDELRGMTVPEAKEYLFHHIATLKLTEKQYQELEVARGRWESRTALARSKGLEDLVQEAEAELRRIEEQREMLSVERETLKTQIEQIRTALPGIAARERRVDPDLLEQELRVTLGQNLGARDTAGSAGSAAAFEALAVNDELAALKAKLGVGDQPGGEAGSR